MNQTTDDARLFGENAIVYCNQHLRPHYTGWCTVFPANKTLLEADTLEDAYKECRRKGYKLYEDIKE